MQSDSLKYSSDKTTQLVTITYCRISVESKSRQAQRTFLRDKDLVKYLAILVALLSWQLVAWSLMQMEGVVVGGLGISMQQAFCHVGYWHLTMQIGLCASYF